MNLLALALAALLLAGSAWWFRNAGEAIRAGALTLNFGFLLWYWIPATNVFLIGYRGAGSFAVPATAAAQALWLVLGYHGAALAACSALRWWDHAAVASRACEPPAWLAATVLGSAILLVFVRFPQPGLALHILAGMTSARDHLTFYNRSSGAFESLTKLWEIINLWTGLFALAGAALNRRLLGRAGIAAAAALVVTFLGSGTRAVLLMAAFAVIAAWRLRPARRGVGRMSFPAVAALVGLLALAATALGGRFKEGFAETVANSLLVNTDMFSETAFALARFPGYRPAGNGDFVLTPFTFLLPRFLGFAKATPEHLVLYNRVRAGYDIVNGQGNVFPGIVGDYQMVFGGVTGALLFALFAAAVVAAADRLPRLLGARAPQSAWRIATLAFLLVSLRNIQGSLVLVMLAGLAIAAATRDRAR